MFRHPNDIIVIKEEGEDQLERCDRCGMFITQKHDEKNKLCLQGAGKKMKRDLDEKRALAKGVRFHVQGQEVEDVADFKYLGRWLSEDDSDIKAIRANIKKAQGKWSRLSRLLVREGANIRMMARFYLTIIQSVLLYGAETWAITQRQLSLLSSFHNRCVRGITRRRIKRTEEGIYECPDMNETFFIANLEPIQEYITRHKERILPYAKTRALYRQCVRTQKAPNAANKIVWWS
jgi:uncharacterized C2H2 Zn-finger protein